MDRPRRSDRPPSRASKSDESGPSRTDAGIGSERTDDRAITGTLRLLLTIAVVCSLALGAFVYGPQLADSVGLDRNGIDSSDGPSPDAEDEDPPQSDSKQSEDRDPDRSDPDDPGETTYDGARENISSNAVEDHVHEKVNERRAEHGLEPIEWDGTIASVSRAHSADMNEREYFAHENPDGENPWDRFEDVGSYCQGYGENIATNWAGQNVERPSDGEVVQYHTAEELAEGLVEQWMNSPPHREAILTEGWDRGGVGVYITDDGEVFATHNFCEER